MPAPEVIPQRYEPHVEAAADGIKPERVLEDGTTEPVSFAEPA